MTTTATIATGGQGEKSLTLTLPDGDLGTDCTVMAMRAIAEDAAQNSTQVNRLARLLDVGHGPDGRSLLPRNLYDWLRAHCRFRRDGRGLEHIRHPDQVLRAIGRDGISQIDCDCLATLAAAVLLAGERRPAFIVVGRHPAPAPFAHVFYGIINDHRTQMPWKFDDAGSVNICPFDPQEKTPAGLWPEGIRRTRIYPL